MESEEDGDRQSGGIQSLDAALKLLSAMVEYRGPVSLSQLARDCGMPPSKAHRYLSSFVNAGLVGQANRSGKYDLAKGAITLGLAALQRHDFVNRAADALPDLCEASGLTALLSVWGSHGATVVRWERAATPVITSMGLGTTLPLLSSATGRVFLAWAPQAPLKTALEAEMRMAKRASNALTGLPRSHLELQALVTKIRADGFASVEGSFIPGLVAISAPILDWQGEAQAAITLVGIDPSEIAKTSQMARRLVAFCNEQSFGTLPVGKATTGE